MDLLVYRGPIGFNFPEDLKTPWPGAVEPFEPAGDQHLALGAELGEPGEGGGETGAGHFRFNPSNRMALVGDLRSVENRRPLRAPAEVAIFPSEF